MSSEISEFQKRVKDIESAYKSARVRTLLIKREEGYAPCVTRIDLLPIEVENGVNEFWPSRSLKVVEARVEYLDIDSLIRSVNSKSLSVNGIDVGFENPESPQWYYHVFHRNQRIGNIEPESTTLRLRGVVALDIISESLKRSIDNEIQLHRTLPFSSIQDLIQRFFDLRSDDINRNLVDIYAPSFVQIQDLRFLGSEVFLRFGCVKETLDDVVIKTTFTTASGTFVPYTPRLRQPSIKDLPGGIVSIEKNFPIPDYALGSIGIDVTLSLKGKSGLDTAYSHNLPIVNPIWYILENIDRTKVGKFFELESFEQRMVDLNNDEIFEGIIASLLSSCGFRVTWIGGFGLSAQDLLAFDTISNPILICECTVGSPRHKIGLMKTALSTLSGRAKPFRFAGIVFTSKPTGDPERQGAIEDHVIIKDVEDIRTLAQISSKAPDVSKVYSWLGIDLWEKQLFHCPSHISRR